jgi:hypothetical protein
MNNYRKVLHVPFLIRWSKSKFLWRIFCIFICIVVVTRSSLSYKSSSHLDNSYFFWWPVCFTRGNIKFHSFAHSSAIFYLYDLLFVDCPVINIIHLLIAVRVIASLLFPETSTTVWGEPRAKVGCVCPWYCNFICCSI